jgi:ribose/xylose/arabinose/galactoside ABC-type transport system permease subunit
MNEKSLDKPSGLSKAALVTGILSFIPGLSLAAIICGIVDLVRISNNQASRRGKGMDIAGIVLGIIMPIIFWIAIWAVLWGALGLGSFPIWLQW